MDDMAPPNKRRRLSGSASQSLPSRSELVAPDPSPTLLHSVEQLEHKPASAATRTVPQHIQEIHLQIQEKPFFGGQEDYRRWHRRQAAAVLSTTTTTDALGNVVVETVTIGAVTTATSTSATSSTEGTGGTGTGTAQSVSGSTSPNTGNSSDTSKDTSKQTGTGGINGGTLSSTLAGSGMQKVDASASGRLSANIPTDNSTTATTRKTTKGTTGNTSDHTTLGPGVYLATLSNDHVETITRSNKPYVTTFADGETSTICDRQGDCKISTHKSAATRNSIKSLSQISSISQPAEVTSTAYVAGASPGPGTGTFPTSSSTSTAQPHKNNNTTPPAGTIAGGVVGGAAGIAVILLIALVFLRWYKRRSQQGHHALPPSSGISPDPDLPPSSRGPGMAERAGLMPLVNAVPGFFRHQNQSQEEPASSERGFTKVSGRKLPSAFSEGMTSGGMSSPPPDMPLTGSERNLSSTSFYRDSHGFYGGEGTTPELAASPESGSPDPGDHVEMTLSPGPQRTPTVHSAGPYVMSPSTSVPDTPRIPDTIPASPPPDTTPTRSDTPSTDNRSSRFTEEV